MESIFKFRKINTTLLVIAASIIIFAGCTKNSTEPAAESNPNKPPAKPQPATATQWRVAAESSFDKIDINRLRDKKNPEYLIVKSQPNSDGTEEFTACFEKSLSTCSLLASAERDEFRKVQFFEDPSWAWDEIGFNLSSAASNSSIAGYVSLIDCREPILTLKPTVRLKNWIFLNQVSIMADGDVIIDRKLEFTETDRRNNHESITETAYILLTKPEVERLSNINGKKQILVRLTGDKGYVSLSSKSIKSFTQGIERVSRIYYKLEQAIAPIGNVQDESCPIKNPQRQ